MNELKKETENAAASATTQETPTLPKLLQRK